MDSLREFFVSSSGLAPVRQGLGLGWVISALTGVAILLGAKEAGACPAQKTTCSSFADCADQDPNAPFRECTSYYNHLCEKYHTSCGCVSVC